VAASALVNWTDLHAAMMSAVGPKRTSIANPAMARVIARTPAGRSDFVTGADITVDGELLWGA
jgi:hypothetical protein